MEEPPTEHDATDDVAVMANSSWLDDASTSITHGAAVPATCGQGVPAAEVTCEALHLALSTVHIDLAWHSGVVSAEASMEALHRAVGRATSRYNRSTRASASGAVSRPAPHKTVSRRAPDLGGETECDPVSVMLPMA
jgi:hypothetical protein